MNLKSRKMRGVLVLLSAILVFAIGGSVGAYISSGSGGSVANEVADMFSLSKPAFAQGMDTTFLNDEAGIAVYLNAAQPLDLSSARSCYRNIEEETSDYIIGSMEVPSVPSIDSDVHCYVHKDGWIVVYYFKHEALTKILDNVYWSGSEFVNTKLDEGIEKIAGCLGVMLLLDNVKRCHFQYPTATNWEIVARYGGEFSINVPAEFGLRERSFYTDQGTIYVDGNSVGSGYGVLTPAQLTQGVLHTISESCTYCTSTYAIGLIYIKPTS